MAGTWSYDPADLASSEKDQIRLEVGDTDSQNWLLSDEEIAWAVTQERNFWAAAARCCELAGTSLLRKADVKLGRSLQIAYTKAAKQFFDRARMLRCKANGTVLPYVGGVYAVDKDTIGTDGSVVAPAFTRTMMENPWVGGYSSNSGEAATNEDVDENLI